MARLLIALLALLTGLLAQDAAAHACPRVASESEIGAPEAVLASVVSTVAETQNDGEIVCRSFADAGKGIANADYSAPATPATRIGIDRARE